jgi:hypothetical protein
MALVPSQLLKPLPTIGAQIVIFSMGANPQGKNAMPYKIDPAN